MGKHLAKTVGSVYNRFPAGPSMQVDRRSKDELDFNKRKQHPSQNDDEFRVVPDKSSGHWYTITGKVRSVDTRAPISGAFCGLIRTSAGARIKRSDIVAYGKSGYNGRFQMNRRVRGGRYIFVAVHKQYRTIRSGVSVNPKSYFFTVTMARKY